MHRSSESIAALAAALAKAQMALTNPEKSLTGTVPSSRYDEPGRTFRYAPLSSGLDIVRKVLGEQGIATLQTTTIDQDIQSVSLTTMLAHASGEWIASDWPVCTLSDLGAPRRMGAALTYARRYALFTLVGIAGEDDLDAPDLGGQPAEGTGETGNGLDTKRQNGDGADQPLGTFARNRKPWSPPNQALAPEESAALCDRMLSEISALASEEQATAWAHKAMGAKNALTTGDCGVVEATFAARLAKLAHQEDSLDPALLGRARERLCYQTTESGPLIPPLMRSIGRRMSAWETSGLDTRRTLSFWTSPGRSQCAGWGRPRDARTQRKGPGKKPGPARPGLCLMIRTCRQGRRAPSRSSGTPRQNFLLR
jgi:hypothetical protein